MTRAAAFILLPIVLLSRISLVTQHPGDVDPALYNISMLRIMASKANVVEAFNHEMSFGYYWLISAIHHLTQPDSARAVLIQNSINAISGFLVIVLTGLIAKRLTDTRVALLAMLILVLDHSLWQWSLYGHPGMLALAFFLFSILYFDHALTAHRQPYLLASGLLALIALVLRVDILFVFGAFLLLWQLRPGSKTVGLKTLVVFYLAIFATYMVIKYWALGSGFEATAVNSHINDQFGLGRIPKALIINLGLFAAGIGVVYTLLGFVSLAIWGIKKPIRLVPALACVLPVFIIAVFERMDFVRISIPIHPVIAIFAALAVVRMLALRAKQTMAMGLLLILAAYGLQTAIVFHPLRNIWQEKFPHQPSAPAMVIRPVPIGWFVSDRLNRVRDEKRLYQHARFITEQKTDMLVVCSDLHYHRMTLLLMQFDPQARVRQTRLADIDSDAFVIETGSNTHMIVNCQTPQAFELLTNSDRWGDFELYFLKDLQFPFTLDSRLPPA